MALSRLLQGAAFRPDQIQAMTAAYEDALRALGLVDRNDPVTEIVAKKIIEIANTGEHDPLHLTALTIQHLGVVHDPAD